MSQQPCHEPRCEVHGGSVELLVTPRARDLGEFEVRRVLPSPRRRMVGPFIFFDHMGPATFPPGRGINVRPHPHVCLATVTYLFEGEILHRDSLGYTQPIRPGAVNLMTAGRGIAHSERAGADLDETSTLHGIQSWMALPAALEETAPAFEHTPAEAIPVYAGEGVQTRVVMGEAFGLRSPVHTHSPTLYLDVALAAGARFALPRGAGDLAAYVVDGEVEIDGEVYGGGVMAVLRPGADLAVAARAPARLMVIGGEPLGERHIWWNFVASDRARIDKAKEDWRAGRFARVVGDEEEFIPLPD